VFTGDASGDFLWRAMHEVGLASQPDGHRAGDGLRLTGARVLAAVRCAPPANKPTPDEQARCRPYLARELELLPSLRVIVPLGGIGWDATLRTLAILGYAMPVARPAFAHGAEAELGRYTLVGSYHPSQQNTFTGRLTQPLPQAVLARAAAVAGLRGADRRVP
jgi:uracil-DNA glycosylase